MDEVIIREYKDEDKNEFRRLNIDWISHFFEMEEADHLALDSPRQYIIDQGGHIFVAIDANQIVGVCALLKRDCKEHPYELAKMAVSSSSRGKGIGLLLGNSIIKKATQLGAKKLYLESNTILEPAINLYRKLGFKEIVKKDTPYKRCNIQMEKEL